MGLSTSDFVLKNVSNGAKKIWDLGLFELYEVSKHGFGNLIVHEEQLLQAIENDNVFINVGCVKDLLIVGNSFTNKTFKNE
jgi:hypothetical protein